MNSVPKAGGRLALGTDLHQVAPVEISATRVDLTTISGRITYRNGIGPLE